MRACVRCVPTAQLRSARAAAGGSGTAAGRGAAYKCSILNKISNTVLRRLRRAPWVNVVLRPVAVVGPRPCGPAVVLGSTGRPHKWTAPIKYWNGPARPVTMECALSDRVRNRGAAEAPVGTAQAAASAELSRTRRCRCSHRCPNALRTLFTPCCCPCWFTQSKVIIG